jgi:hypothetical protein
MADPAKREAARVRGTAQMHRILESSLSFVTVMYWDYHAKLSSKYFGFLKWS